MASSKNQKCKTKNRASAPSSHEKSVCVLCENNENTFSSVQEFWLHGTSFKQKMSLLQVDKNLVLRQIRSSHLYNPNFDIKRMSSNLLINNNNNKSNSAIKNPKISTAFTAAQMNTKERPNAITPGELSSIITSPTNSGNTMNVSLPKSSSEVISKLSTSINKPNRKSVFGNKATTCLCPACKKRKAIFNVVVKGT